MSVQTEADSQRQSWDEEDAIDLRPYLHNLLQWRREILAITLIAVILALLAILAIRILLPLQYVTYADVAIVRTTSDVTFDERFRTTEEDLGTESGNRSARRSALLGLVTSGAIAQQVITELGDNLGESEQIPANLLPMIEAQTVVQAGSRADSDLIRIIVTADDPEKASLIANAWAKTYVHEINQLYSQVPNEVLISIQAEQAKAQQDYLAAQVALEDFISNNRIEELTALTSVLQQRIAQEVSLQEAVLARWQKVQEQLAVAKSLLVQLKAGDPEAARSTMTALQLLKINVYGMSANQLQLEVRDFPELSNEVMSADISGMIVSLEEQYEELEIQIVTNPEQLSTDDKLQSVLSELSTVRAALEAEQAQQRQLTQRRDLNWETYRTLSNKVAELNLTRAAATSEVRFGSEAVPPTFPTRRVSFITGALVAGTFGFAIALFTVFLASYLGASPFLVRRSGLSIAPKPAT